MPAALLTPGAVFQIDSVSGTMPGEAGSGLGPTFNGNSCAQCHAQPAAGAHAFTDEMQTGEVGFRQETMNTVKPFSTRKRTIELCGDRSRM